jgi:uncharacterized protein (TIGR02646 family)
MRPVERGPWPVDETGAKKDYKKYRKARRDLVERLGSYCSYCERRHDEAPAVEHVQPKSRRRELERDWDNLLLACRNCNSTKGSRDLRLEDYFWPDVDNTFLAFEYLEGGRVRPVQTLSPELRRIAERTLALTGLDRTPAPDPAMKDERWRKRQNVWEIATRNRARLAADAPQQTRDAIVDLALGYGYWSVWMTVFRDDPDMRGRFIAAFPGTCVTCFDVHRDYAPLNRNPQGL